MTLNPRVPVYKVKKGDTLWGIAKDQYGDPDVWPEIKKANRLAKGNLILVGQTLTIPPINRVGPSGSVFHSPSLSKQPCLSEAGMVARAVRIPSFKFPLKEVSIPVPPTPHVRIKITLKGEITFQEEGSLVEISSKGDIDLTAYKTQVANKNSGLFSNAKIGYDLANRTASLSIELAAAAKIDGHVFTTPKTGFAILGPPDPGWKFTSDVEPIEGEWRGFSFDGTFGFEIEIHPNQQRASGVPVPALSPGAQWFTLGAILLVGTTLVLAPEILPVFALAGENSVAFSEVFTLLGAKAMLK